MDGNERPQISLNELEIINERIKAINEHLSLMEGMLENMQSLFGKFLRRFVQLNEYSKKMNIDNIQD